MFRTNQPDHADAFRRMPQPDAGRILVLPNAWDAMSARLIEDAGARAIATTSAAWRGRWAARTARALPATR